jgi:catechol 2,3-dioxygenase-like lactoylglutathione lyase family enzyme
MSVLANSMMVTTVAVSDLDRARAFFTDQLQLPVLEDQPFAVRYGAGRGARLSGVSRGIGFTRLRSRATVAASLTESTAAGRSEEDHMIQNIIGAIVGAAVTYIMLWFTVGSEFSDKYLPAVIVGGIVYLLWPIVIGFVLARRAKARRDDKISAEVERQVAEQNKGA